MMSDVRRREFLAAPLALAAEVSLAGRFYRLTFDPKTGCASLTGARGGALLVNATAAAVFPRGEALVSDARYTRTARGGYASAQGLEGEQLAVACRDQTRTLDLEWRLTLLATRPGAVFELVATNVSASDIILRRSEPLRALLDEDAGCYFGARQALTQGYMHHDPGGLVELGRPFRAFTSHWNVALTRGASRGGLVIGYLENTDAEGQVWGEGQMTRGGPNTQIGLGLAARSVYARHFVLRPGASVSSGRVLLLSADDPMAALESYAELAGRLHGVTPRPIINGWCSWFYTHLTATEDEQLLNARFIAQHLRPYGMEWVQIDDGWQRSFGDWEAGSLYPHGMQWLAGQIRELGLRPGIWIAPHVIDAESEVARRHGEWLLRDARGEVQATGSSRSPKSLILDITHPEARRWIYDLFRRIRHDWGYEFIKLDFPGWTILAAERYGDASVSKAQAYRLFLRTVRDAVGPDCHILDCGPGALGMGLVDSMRVEQDADALDWRHYARRFNAAAPSMALRYYFHKRTWINDADHLGLARLTIPQAQAAASVIALSGGTVISGDRLPELDPARLEILRRVLPAYGEAARPLDLFDTAYPETFAVKVRGWWVLGCFNWDEGAHITRDIDLARAGLPAGKTWLLHEFWSQKLLAGGRVQLEPSSVALIAVRESLPHPQVLGTDRHYTQGAVELDGVRWDAARRTLSGVALGGRGTTWRMTVRVPQGFTWAEPDQADYSAIAAPGLLRVRFDFARAQRVEWALRFK